MRYTIETLEIELNKIKGTLRAMRAISVEIMSDHPDKDHYLSRENEIKEAIEQLEKNK